MIGVHFHLSLIDIPIRLQYWQHEDSNAGLAGLQVLTALHLPLPMSAWAAQATASSYLANESSFKAQRLFPVIWRPSRDIFDKAMTFLQELLYDIQHQISLFQLSASALLKQFLIEVLRHPGQDRSPSSTNRVSPRAIDFFRENLREGFSLQKVAHHIGYHPNYFAACFREETGLTPWSYYMLMRLAEARRMLREGNHTIAEIASTLGFCTSSYFTRIFRQYEGVTPSEYRRLQS